MHAWCDPESVYLDLGASSKKLVNSYEWASFLIRRLRGFSADPFIQALVNNTSIA